VSLVPAWSTPDVSLYTGDAITTLTAFPAGSIDCVVTSPPYYGLRDYGTAIWSGGAPDCRHNQGAGRTPLRGGGRWRCTDCGAKRVDQQYGLEPTPHDYVDTLRRLFAQLRRVLTPAGTVWLNLGDSYVSTGSRAARPHGPNSVLPGSYHQRQSTSGAVSGLTAKNLLGMPWRVALAVQADGWVLRNAVVWAKRNPMPESVKDRLSTTYEFVFLLTANSTYFFDLDAIRVPLQRPEALAEDISVGGNRVTEGALLGVSGRRRSGSVYGKYRDSTVFVRGGHGSAVTPTGRRHDNADARGKNPGDVWQMSTRPLRAAHFAAFPIDLPLRCIAAGCPPEGVVLDPFSGAATTGLAALQLGRRYIGIELNPAYNQLAQSRLLHARGQANNSATHHRPVVGKDMPPSAGPVRSGVVPNDSLDVLTPPGVDGRLPLADPAINHPGGRASQPRSHADQEPARTTDPCPRHPCPTPGPVPPGTTNDRQPAEHDTPRPQTGSSDTAGQR
jgi:DNA modification methylase